MLFIVPVYDCSRSESRHYKASPPGFHQESLAYRTVVYYIECAIMLILSALKKIK